MNKVLLVSNDVRVAALTVVFAHLYYRFNTKQVRDLVQMVQTDEDRLMLLQSSFRIISDRSKFSSMSDILLTANARGALSDYVIHYAGE